MIVLPSLSRWRPLLSALNSFTVVDWGDAID
jgi:hypothetical protein